MIKEFTVFDGARFIGLARKAISYYLSTGTTLLDFSPDKRYEKKRGVFVTLHSYPSMQLRGCIGFPQPTIQLWQGIIEAATGAAFSDPRFQEIESEKEMNSVLIEVSVLTEPMEIKWKKKPEELLEKICIGKDGLIAKQGGNSGLLLPQVAPEWKWEKQEFLEQTCRKAGLKKEAWRDKETTFQKFQAQIFKEKKPNSSEITEE